MDRDHSMTDMSGERLPRELQFEIIGYLERKYLQNARLISKAWEYAANPHLFDSIYISTHPHDLDFSNKIVKSRFGRHVKTLVYDSSAFNPSLVRRLTSPFLEHTVDGIQRDFETFSSLFEIHIDCPHENPKYSEHVEDAASKRRFHGWLANLCDNDTDRMLQLRERWVRKVYSWWLEQEEAHEEIVRTGQHLRVLRELLADGLKISHVILTSLPVGPDHEFRPDEPFSQPSRSPTVKKWEKGLVELREDFIEEEELTTFEGFVPLQEIVPQVDWTTSDRLFLEVSRFVANGGAYQRWAHRGFSRQQWHELRDRRMITPVQKCYHPVAAIVPYTGLLQLVGTFLETSTSVSEFSIVPSRKPRPTDYEAQLHQRLQSEEDEGISAAIFLNEGPELRMLMHFVSQLRVARLSLHAVSGMDGTLYSYRGLIEMLRRGEHIEELYLDFSGYQYLSQKDLLGRLKLRSLRKVHLSDLAFSDRDFLKLIHEHVSRLEELVVFYCTLLDEHRDSDGDAWWWPLLDELRAVGVFDAVKLYINRVMQPVGDVMVLEGDAARDEGMAQWKEWVEGVGQFPLSTADRHNRLPFPTREIPSGYRQCLRTAIAEMRSMLQ